MSLSMWNCSGSPGTKYNCFTVSWMSGKCEMMSNHLFSAKSIFASWSSLQETESVLETTCLQCSATWLLLRGFTGLSGKNSCWIEGGIKRFHWLADCSGEPNCLLQKMLPQIRLFQGILRSLLGSRWRHDLSSRSSQKFDCRLLQVMFWITRQSPRKTLWCRRSQITYCVDESSTYGDDGFQIP